MMKDKIVVSGSLAYDKIMFFQGKFKDCILPEKTHILNISFQTDILEETFGGTAGNMAYNLSLLGERAKVLGVVGDDFAIYEKWMRKNNIDCDFIKKVKNEKSAVAHIITDQDDNQISAYYSGPKDYTHCQVAYKLKSVKIAIIAPEEKSRMLEYTKIYQELKIPYIFDPGQQIGAFSGKELKEIIGKSNILIGNDYEISLICKKIKKTLKELKNIVKTLIITKGGRGSEIYFENNKIKIEPVRVKKLVDPTGAGDAYRAGLIYGLSRDWELERAGKLASLLASYAVEKDGTQNHKYSSSGIKKRYKLNYKEELKI